MGIQNFNKWLRTDYSDALIASVGKRKFYHHVYIDLNVLLHGLTHNKTEEDLLNGLCSTISKILTYVIPLRTLTLASDGIAPLAKMILQRERRLKNLRKNEEDVKNNFVNPLWFTPGTYFMTSLGNNLTDFIQNLEKKFDITVTLLTNERGEAEMKLTEQILLNNSNYKNEKHCVYCSDADVVVIMTAIDVKNIFVHNKENIIDIDKLLILHKNKINKNMSIKNIAKDFCFISLLMGNDYIPKLCHITFDIIWESYIETVNLVGYDHMKKNLIVKDDIRENINVQFFKKLLQILIVKFSKKNIHFKNEFLIDMYDKKSYDNYIAGLLWCFDTYRNGKQPLNQMYMFNSIVPIHPFGLLYHFEFNNFNDFNDVLKTQLYNSQNNTKINIDDEIYATLILPRAAKHLINYTWNYKNIVNNSVFDKLYEIEDCKICDENHEQISELQQQYVKLKNELPDDNNTDNTCLLKTSRKALANMQKKVSTHNASHTGISFDDIVNIINIIKSSQTTKINNINNIKREHIIKYKLKNKNLNYLF